jgi:hypothetical protein
MTDMEQELFNSMKSSRKADREFIAATLLEIAQKHGADFKRRDESRTIGYCRAGIMLQFELNDVGAMLNINNLHGGSFALIHWYSSTLDKVQYYSSTFNVAVGASSGGRRHHKATSCPADWYSLAKFLDGGLLLAASGRAFDPVP